MQCTCGDAIDEFGHHILLCRRRGGRNPETHRSMTSFTGPLPIPAVLEPPGICRSDRKKPDGMTVAPCKQGAHRVVVPANVHTRGAGSAAIANESRKRLKYALLQPLPTALGLLWWKPWEPGDRNRNSSLRSFLVTSLNPPVTGSLTKNKASHPKGKRCQVIASNCVEYFKISSGYKKM